MKTNTTFVELTPEEVEILRTTTPEQWADVATECVKDPTFWCEIGTAIVTGFVTGFMRGLDV